MTEDRTQTPPPDAACVVLHAGEGRTTMGGRLLFKASASDTRGAYSLQETTMPPGIVVPPHTHAHEEEAWYVLEGELTFTLDGRETVAPAGSFVLVPRGSVHGFGNRSDARARFLELFSPSGMERYFEERQALADASDGGDYAGIDPAAHRELAARYGMAFTDEG